jgi:hypothetical protein
LFHIPPWRLADFTCDGKPVVITNVGGRKFTDRIDDEDAMECHNSPNDIKYKK